MYNFDSDYRGLRNWERTSLARSCTMVQSCRHIAAENRCVVAGLITINLDLVIGQVPLSSILPIPQDSVEADPDKVPYNTR